MSEGSREGGVGTHLVRHLSNKEASNGRRSLKRRTLKGGGTFNGGGGIPRKSEKTSSPCELIWRKSIFKKKGRRKG